MMWICIERLARLLRHRVCLVLFVALAVISMTEAPRAKAQDILKGVHQDRSLELYYAAVTTVIPTAVTSVLAEQFQEPVENEEEKHVNEKSNNQGKDKNSVNSNANVSSLPHDVNGHRKVNDRNKLMKTNDQSVVHGMDQTENIIERTKDRTDHFDNEDRIINELVEQLADIEGNVQLVDENIIPTEKTLPLPENILHNSPNFVNTQNNIYEIFEEEDIFDDDDDDDDDEEEEDLGPIVERTRKDTSHLDGVTWQSLQRLAEFATASNPDLSLINLVTPNPDIEITIEVLPGLGTDDEEIISSDNEVTQTKPPRKKGKGKRGKRKRKKDKDKDSDRTNKGGEQVSPNIPSRHGGATSTEEETNKPDNNGDNEDESSYSFHIGGPLLPFIPNDFEDFNFPDDAFPMEEKGEWSDWSRCTASCGGGRTERSRSCGFSCTSTETQDCNQHSCPEIEYLDSQIIAGVQPVLQTSTPAIQTTDELFRYLDPSLPEFETDSCAEWMSCRSEQLMSLLSRLEDLPSCPCFYPTTIRANDLIWDKIHRKMFRWIVSDSKKESLDIYKPTSKYCIRSLLSAQSTSLAAQQCCYDETMRLITRGPGAGTPNLISREISPELNYKIDVLPWIICKGDWSKYNDIRHPNNARGCREFPGDEAYQAHLEELNDF